MILKILIASVIMLACSGISLVFSMFVKDEDLPLTARIGLGLVLACVPLIGLIGVIQLVFGR